jgi:hypothetical protein
MAVHFWPAFWVMSRSTSFRKKSYVSDPGAASGPRMAALRLSASTLTRTEWRITLAIDRILTPVSPEPVKATTSCGPRCSRTSPALPTRSESAPSGSTPFSTSSSVIRCATMAELVAGLLTTGTPARIATAAFSAKPQAGKVEGVDVHGHAAARHRDVLAVEARRTAELDPLAVHHEAGVAQRLSDLGIRRKRERRAVHVELGVAACVSAVAHGQVQDLVAVGLDHVRTWP